MSGDAVPGTGAKELEEGRLVVAFCGAERDRVPAGVLTYPAIRTRTWGGVLTKAHTLILGAPWGCDRPREEQLNSGHAKSWIERYRREVDPAVLNGAWTWMLEDGHTTVFAAPTCFFAGGDLKSDESPFLWDYGLRLFGLLVGTKVMRHPRQAHAPPGATAPGIGTSGLPEGLLAFLEPFELEVRGEDAYGADERDDDRMSLGLSFPRVNGKARTLGRHPMGSPAGGLAVTAQLQKGIVLAVSSDVPRSAEKLSAFLDGVLALRAWYDPKNARIPLPGRCWTFVPEDFKKKADVEHVYVQIPRPDGAQSVLLTWREATLVELLHSRAPEVVSYEEIWKELQGEPVVLATIKHRVQGILEDAVVKLQRKLGLWASRHLHAVRRSKENEIEAGCQLLV